jgi:hypothetical protein
MTIRICSLGIIVLSAGLVIAYLGAYDYLQVDLNVIIPITLIVFALFVCGAASSMMAGTSFIANMPFPRQPKSPEEGILKRLVKNRESGKEYIISGSRENTYRDALLHDWPFLNQDHKTNWYIVDEYGNDITDKFLFEYDSIAEIVFE